MKRNYKNVDIIKGKESDDFKRFLKTEGIYYEASGNGNRFIHFEVLVDDDEEETVNSYLEDPNYYWSDERYYWMTGNPWDV